MKNIKIKTMTFKGEIFMYKHTHSKQSNYGGEKTFTTNITNKRLNSGYKNTQIHTK